MSPVYFAPWDLDKVVQTLFYMPWNVQYPSQDLQILRNLLSQSIPGGSIFRALHLVVVLYLCPVWQASSWSLEQQSYFTSQNLYRGLWNQRAGVTLPYHTSWNRTYNHVLNILVLKGIFSHTITGVCLVGPAISFHILVSLHLAGPLSPLSQPVSQTERERQACLELQVLLTLLFRKCQSSQSPFFKFTPPDNTNQGG